MSIDVESYRTRLHARRQEIAEKRLDMNPAVALCIACARAQEA